MAVSGAGGWIPSTSATIRGRRLELGPISQNKPREIVLSDMSMAADLLRHDPARIVQVDTRGGGIARLREYLAATGHIESHAPQQGGGSHRQRPVGIDAAGDPAPPIPTTIKLSCTQVDGQ